MSAGGSAVEFGFVDRHAELFHLAIEIGAVEAEDAGGVAHVVLGAFDGAADVFLLEPIGGFRQPQSVGEVFVGVALGAEDKREIVGADLVSSGEERDALHEIAQLADVAGPAVELEPAGGVRPDEELAPVGLTAEAFEEKFRERQDVFGTFPQGWDIQGDDAEPVIKILPESFLADHFGEAGVGRREDPDVNRNGL